MAIVVNESLTAEGWKLTGMHGVTQPSFGEVGGVAGIKGKVMIGGVPRDAFQVRNTSGPVYVRELPEASQADLNHLFGVGKKDQPKTNLGETW